MARTLWDVLGAIADRGARQSVRCATPLITMFFNRSMAMPWPRSLAASPAAAPYRVTYSP